MVEFIESLNWRKGEAIGSSEKSHDSLGTLGEQKCITHTSHLLLGGV